MERRALGTEAPSGGDEAGDDAGSGRAESDRDEADRAASDRDEADRSGSDRDESDESEGSGGSEGSKEPNGSNESNETELERWQRNFAELLQELRVAQMGVQILFAFLLSLAFSGRVNEGDRFERTTYMVALLSAAAATALLIAPVAHHRMLFRRGRKPEIVRSAHRMASGGLALLLIAMVASVLLATNLVVAQPVAIAVAVATGLWFVYLWGVAPWTQRRRADAAGEPDDRDGP